MKYIKVQFFAVMILDKCVVACRCQTRNIKIKFKNYTKHFFKNKHHCKIKHLLHRPLQHRYRPVHYRLHHHLLRNNPYHYCWQSH